MQVKKIQTELLLSPDIEILYNNMYPRSYMK